MDFFLSLLSASIWMNAITRYAAWHLFWHARSSGGTRTPWEWFASLSPSLLYIIFFLSFIFLFGVLFTCLFFPLPFSLFLVMFFYCLVLLSFSLFGYRFLSFRFSVNFIFLCCADCLFLFHCLLEFLIVLEHIFVICVHFYACSLSSFFWRH